MLLTTILFGLPLIGFACAKTAQPFPTPQVEKRLEPYCVNGVRGPPSKTWDSVPTTPNAEAGVATWEDLDKFGHAKVSYLAQHYLSVVLQYLI
ncbi:hypothetical protein SMMN14_04570 [Sphaerulina musiva]